VRKGQEGEEEEKENSLIQFSNQIDAQYLLLLYLLVHTSIKFIDFVLHWLQHREARGQAPVLGQRPDGAEA
jgi:hypothetical protein